MSTTPILRDSTHNYILPTTNTLTTDELTSNSSTQTLTNKTLIDPTITINGTDLKTEILKTIYPIGSIYISMNDTSPDIILGFGTWTPIIDRFLYCSNTSGTIGGEAEHTHTLENSAYACLSITDYANTNNRAYLYPKIDTNKSYYSNYGYYYNDTYLAYGEWAPGVKRNSAICVEGNTNNATSLPPYMTVFAWQRTE